MFIIINISPYIHYTISPSMFQLDKWLNAQFRCQSFFAAPSSSCSSHPSSSTTSAEFYFHLANLAAFSSQIVQHCRANVAAIQMALGLLADGISLASIPPPHPPSGPNNLLGPLFCLHLDPPWSFHFRLTLWTPHRASILD
jgi:hypothetical protein